MCKTKKGFLKKINFVFHKIYTDCGISILKCYLILITSTLLLHNVQKN